MTPIERKARELLPCPFCGGSAHNVSHESCDCCGKRYNGMVMCSVCGGCVDHRDSAEQADIAWNTRTALTPPAGGLPELVAKWRRQSEGCFTDRANAVSRCADELEALVGKDGG